MSPGSCLIVDDDQAFLNALAAALARRGYRCHRAQNIAQSLMVAESEAPEYAVVDLRLADESGLSLIEPLKRLNPAIRIVVLSGFASIATAVEAIKLGATHYLTKPTDADEIEAAFAAEEGDSDAAIRTEPIALDRVEWEHIQQTLMECDGNVSEAAKRLGLHRRTLQRKLQKRPAGLD
ncbi:MAG: response regulator [Pseudomonadota bacterium]